MNDIIFCFGESCILKLKCFRFTAEISGRRNTFGQAPFDEKTNTCQHFKTNYSQIEQTAYFLWKNDGERKKSEYYWIKAEKIIQSKF